MFKKILLLVISSLFACCATSAETKALSAEPNFGRYDSKQVATKDRQELVKYAQMGGYVIYVDGLIDLSEGKIPQNGNSLGLDKFISEISGGEFDTYTKFMQAYGASCHANLVQ